MTTLVYEPPRRPNRIHHSRTWRVTGAVLMAHAGMAWLLSLGLLSSSPPTGEAENVIMASVVVDVPAPPAVIPQPVVTKVQPKTQARPLTPVTPQPQPQPSPVVTQAEPSQAAPIVPATASPAPATAAPVAPAAAPAAVGQPRPNPITATAAVALPSSDADYLNNPVPAYPRMSKRLAEQGTVTARVHINTEGRVEQAEIRTSSGYPRLDEAALETVKRWRYVPGKRAGVPEAMWFNVPVRFVLG